MLIVAEAGQFNEQWAEYILFAALLLVVCVIFAIMAQFYTYVNPAEIEAQFDKDKEKKNPENPYYTLDPVSQTQMWMSASKWRMDWAQNRPWPLSPGGRTLCSMAPDGEDFRIVNQAKKAIL